MDYYNNCRIKVKLKGLSPVEFRTQSFISTKLLSNNWGALHFQRWLPYLSFHLDSGSSRLQVFPALPEDQCQHQTGQRQADTEFIDDVRREVILQGQRRKYGLDK